MNAELIKALRCGTVKGDEKLNCTSCNYSHGDCCWTLIMLDAADAIEADEQRIDGLQKLVDINTERCEALRKQLREAHENYEKHLNELTTKCNQLQAAVDNYEKRIAELEAETERLKASNEELRERQTYIDHWGNKWMTSGKDVPTAAYNHGFLDGEQACNGGRRWTEKERKDDEQIH